MKYANKNLFMIIMALLSLIVSAVGATPASAAHIWMVSSVNDPGVGNCTVDECTLREAITEAASGDTIGFDLGLSGATITLNATLTINKNLTIDGSLLPSVITIGGAGARRVFQVDAGSTVIFNSLRIANGNSGAAQGGAMLINSGATVNITNSTFDNNTSAYISTAGIPGGGGAIYNAGTLTISGSTFSGNTATGSAGDGGAIMSVGSITISNSTFYNNSAVTDDGAGGAVRLHGGPGPNTLTHVTFSGNASDALFGALDISSTAATLSSSILANSTSGVDCTRRDAGTVNSSNNLIETGSSCFPMITLDPALGPLQNNGGPTQTMALSDLSPALGTGDPTICAGAPVSGKDQRGQVRPQGDTNCDIGAFESSSNIAPSLLSFTRKTPTTSPTNANSLTFRATFSEPVQNVNATDFAVAGTTASISAPVPSFGGLTYDITISGGNLASLNGTVGLDLKDTQDIQDLSGNLLPDGDPTTDQTYLMDNIAPVATIGVFPNDPSNSPVANFGFSATDGVSSVFSFSCNLDGAGWENCSTDPISSGGTKSYSGLTEGVHTFQLNVADAAGNSLTPNFEEYSWTIALPPAPPVVTAPIMFTNDNTPTISGTAQVGSTVDVFWFDSSVAPSGSWQPIPACQDVVVNGSGNWTCVSDITLPNGEIDLAVYATDSGGPSDPTSHTFTVFYCADVHVSVGNDVHSCHNLANNDVLIDNYSSLLDGPVKVVSRSGDPIVTSQRVVFGNSFNELMGYPADQFTTEYWFPWYDTVYMNTWILVGNPSTTQTAYVDIYIGGDQQGDTFVIPPGDRVTPLFQNVLDGPVRVVSVTGAGTPTAIPIFASERSTYQGSFNEVMGYPADQFTTEYWFPWYDQIYMNSWILVGNPSTTQTAYVDIYIGGDKQGTTSAIPPSGNITPQFSGVIDGPVRVVSVTGSGTPTAIPIFASERSLYGSSFNEVMGYPSDQFTTEYWYPWYDNLGMDSWILIGNPSTTQTAYVDIYIGGVKRNDTDGGVPFAIPPSGNLTPRFDLSNGPVQVVSVTGSGTSTPLPIFTSERSLYGPSFNEVMGYPANQLSSEYWFTWYDSIYMATDVVVGVP